jgi:hypothetical protein
MTSGELAQYLGAVGQATRLPVFIERFFQTDADWERVAAHEFRSVRLSSRTETTLDQVCARRAAIVLGEPGAGKSTIARAAVQRALGLGIVPLFGQLRSYAGDLAALLAQTVPPDLVARHSVDGRAIERVLILDGFDEVPLEYLDGFVADCDRTVNSGTYSHTLLTSRQAFYASNRHRLRSPIEAFYLLGFSERDVRTFVQHKGGDLDLFLAEVGKLGLWSEVTNPFALEVLYQTFVDTGTLGSLRSDAVEHVVGSLIASRTHVAADRQRRALRMLAVAMETAARNELSIPEAVRLLQAATPVAADDAEALLDELTHSILIRTPSGIAFQMRSYGEYLAAVELRGMSLERIQLLVNYEHTMIPNESWRNCISYLAELHQGVRRSFAIRNPDWVMAASPAAFTEAERTTAMTRLLDRLADTQKYVRRHPFLRAEIAARFVTPEIERRIMADATATDPVRAGNAMVMLGATKNALAVDIALPIALSRDYPQLFRESAISAVAAAGTSALIPTLIQALRPDDPLHLSLVDCLGALTDAASIPTVLPLLVATDAMVSSAFYRFRELRSREAVQAFLDYMTANPTVVSARRLSSYTDPLWEAMVDAWEPEWADPVGDLLVAWERAHVTHHDVEEAIEAIRRLPDRGEAVGRAILARFLASGEKPFFFSWIVAGLVTPSVAEWLAQQPNAGALMETVARFGRGEVRSVLAPHLGPLIEQQDRAMAAVGAAELRRHERAERRLAAQQRVIRTAQKFGSVLEVLSRLTTKDWPDVDEPRKAWLAQQCESWLQQIDPLRNVRWHSENQLSHHPALPWLGRVVDHYAIRIGNDVLLVQTLMSAEGNQVAAYHQRYGLSAAAIAEVERILADRNTPSGAVYHFLGFIGTAKISTAALGTALLAIAGDTERPDHIRSWAIRLAYSAAVPDADLVTLAGRIQGSLKDEAEQGLIERQHRPTIERRIATLLGDDEAMRAGEVSFPHDSQLSWIAHVKNDVFWPRLVELRAQALRLELSTVAGVVTEAMSRIDGVRLAGVVREQIPLTPVAWREVQELRAAQHEREARIRQAQATPFERVLQRLRATTIGLFKIWCEGLTDGPTIEEFLAKVPGAADVEIITHSLGGWNNILSPSWRPDRLRDGCHDLIVLLDGDKGRDFNSPDHPLNANGQRVRSILAEAGVELVVLERYGIENYFSRQACEEVLGQTAAARFPVLPYARANLQHDKNLNPRIARRMDIGDIAGTDLRRILEQLVVRARV